MNDTKEKNIRIPAALFVAMRKALRSAARDTRRDDRVLHDTTRDEVLSALDAMDDWHDRKAVG